MKVLLVDGHPDVDRLCPHLLDAYAAALPQNCEVTRVAVRDMRFTPNLKHGYLKRTDWEPDVAEFAAQIDACDHIVFAFPMWWGAEPAQLKGLLDRVLLPGFAFSYHDNDPWWDRLLEGRSADVIVTMDTPPAYLWLAYGNAIIRRWKRQVLGFVGFDPVRFLALGPVRKGGAEKSAVKWGRKIEKLARSIRTKTAEKKKRPLAAFLHRGSH